MPHAATWRCALLTVLRVSASYVALQIVGAVRQLFREPSTDRGARFRNCCLLMDVPAQLAVERVGGLEFLHSLSVRRVVELSTASARVVTAEDRSVVVVASQPLWVLEAVLTALLRAVAATGVAAEVLVLSTVSAAAHGMHPVDGEAMDFDAYAAELQRQARGSTVAVRYFPLHVCVVAERSADARDEDGAGVSAVFTLSECVPACVAPLTLSRLRRHGVDRVAIDGDASRLASSVADVSADALPRSVRQQYRALAHALAGAMRSLRLDVESHVFGTGKTASLVGNTMVEVLRDTKAAEEPEDGLAALRRVPLRRASLVLVDRTCDALAPLTTGGGATLLDRMQFAAARLREALPVVPDQDATCAPPQSLGLHLPSQQLPSACIHGRSHAPIAVRWGATSGGGGGGVGSGSGSGVGASSRPVSEAVLREWTDGGGLPDAAHAATASVLRAAAWLPSHAGLQRLCASLHDVLHAEGFDADDASARAGASRRGGVAAAAALLVSLAEAVVDAGAAVTCRHHALVQMAVAALAAQQCTGTGSEWTLLAQAEAALHAAAVRTVVDPVMTAWPSCGLVGFVFFDLLCWCMCLSQPSAISVEGALVTCLPIAIDVLRARDGISLSSALSTVLRAYCIAAYVVRTGGCVCAHVLCALSVRC